MTKTALAMKDPDDDDRRSQRVYSHEPWTSTVQFPNATPPSEDAVSLSRGAHQFANDRLQSRGRATLPVRYMNRRTPLSRLNGDQQHAVALAGVSGHRVLGAPQFRQGNLFGSPPSTADVVRRKPKEA